MLVLTISPALKEAVRASCRIRNFCGSIRTKKSMNGVYRTNIDCSFIREMVENYCTLGKIQPWSTIDQG